MILHGNWVRGSRLKKSALEKTGLWLATRQLTSGKSGESLDVSDGNGEGGEGGEEADNDHDKGHRKKALETWMCKAPSGVFFVGDQVRVPRN